MTREDTELKNWQKSAFFFHFKLKKVWNGVNFRQMSPNFFICNDSLTRLGMTVDRKPGKSNVDALRQLGSSNIESV